MELIKFDGIKMSSLFVHACSWHVYGIVCTQHKRHQHWMSWCYFIYLFVFFSSLVRPRQVVFYMCAYIVQCILLLIIDKVSVCIVYKYRKPTEMGACWTLKGDLRYCRKFSMEFHACTNFMLTLNTIELGLVV